MTSPFYCRAGNSTMASLLFVYYLILFRLCNGMKDNESCFIKKLHVQIHKLFDNLDIRMT